MIVICPKQGESGKSLPCKAFSGSSAQRDKCTSAQRDTETREGGEMCTVHYSGEKLRRNGAKTKSNKAKHTPMVVSVKPTITEQGRRQINFAWGKGRTLKYQVFVCRWEFELFLHWIAAFCRGGSDPHPSARLYLRLPLS